MFAKSGCCCVDPRNSHPVWDSRVSKVRAYDHPMSVVMIALGVVLILLGLGLAFTIFGLIALLLGVVCIGVGAIGLSRAELRRKHAK